MFYFYFFVVRNNESYVQKDSFAQMLINSIPSYV